MRATRTPGAGRSVLPKVVLQSVPAAVLVGGLSLLQTVNYDEAYWLAVVRKLVLGETLYETIWDNKGPLFYPFPFVADWIPGDYQVGRAVLLAATASFLFILVSLILRRDTGTSSAQVTVYAPTVVLAVFAITSFYMSVEIVGITFVVAAVFLARTNPLGAGLILLLAVLADPRLVLFTPAAVWATAKRPWTARSVVSIAVPPILGCLAYLAVPDLRFAVVEFGLATRGVESGLFDYLPIWSLAALPLLVGGLYLPRSGKRISLVGMWFLFGGLLYAGLSAAPFLHYYAFLPLTFVFLQPSLSRRATATVLWPVIAALALLPTYLYGAQLDSTRRVNQAPYLEALNAIEPDLDEHAFIVTLTFVPFPMTRFPELVHAPGPAAHPYIIETSRQERYFAQFEDWLTIADQVWIDAADGLDSDLVQRQFEVPLALIESSGRFTCRSQQGPLLILSGDGSDC